MRANKNIFVTKEVVVSHILPKNKENAFQYNSRHKLFSGLWSVQYCSLFENVIQTSKTMNNIK